MVYSPAGSGLPACAWQRARSAPAWGGAASPADGKALFARYHGEKGDGESPTKKAFGAHPPRDLTDASRQRRRSDDALVEVISSGKNAMPCFAAALAPAQIRDIVKHVRTLAKRAGPHEMR